MRRLLLVPLAVALLGAAKVDVAKFERERFSDRYATVSGTYHALNPVNGDHDIYSGTLSDIQRVRLSFTGSDYRALRLAGADAYFWQQVRSAAFRFVVLGTLLALVAWPVRALLRRKR